MALDQKAKELAAAGKKPINLTAGQVDLPMPDSGKEAVRAALTADLTGYVPAAGSADLKETVRKATGWTDGQILVSAGAKPLLSAAILCVCGPGDEVLLPTPCYVSYPEMIRLSGAVPVPVPCLPEDRFIATRERLERHVSDRTKALLLNNPCNPTGTVYSEAELRSVVDFCAAHDLWIIADEVYGGFVYDGGFVSLYSFPEVRERLILTNSVSKSFAMAGLRLGYAVVPDAVAAAMSGCLSHMIGCPCSLSERAAKAVLEQETDYTARVREIFRRRRDLFVSSLSGIPRLRVLNNDGAFYLWLDVSEIEKNDVLFCQKLLTEKGVALTPGSAFFGSGYVRVAYTKDESLLLDAAERIRDFVGSYR